MRWIFAATAIALLLAACGDDDTENNSKSTPTASQAENPTLTFAGTVTPAPDLPEISHPPNPPRLAYEDKNGVMWLVDSEGTGRFRLTDRCPAVDMQWSPDGNLLACSYFTIRVFDLQGRTLWEKNDTPNIAYLVWSPDSHQLAYRDIDGAIHIADVNDGSDTVIVQNGFPIVWLADGRILAGLNVQEEVLGISYDVYWVDKSSGQSARAADFDESGILMFADRRRAIVSRHQYQDNAEVVLHDFVTGEESPLVAQGTDGLRLSPVTISLDGLTFYGTRRVDLAPTPTPNSGGGSLPAFGMIVYECSIPYRECDSIGTVEGLLLSISGEGLVSYLEPGDYWEPMRIADLRSGTVTYVGYSTPRMTWWP